MEWRGRFRPVLRLLLLLSALWSTSDAQCQNECSQTPSGWNSNIRIHSIQTHSVSLSWDVDNRLNTTNYTVEYRSQLRSTSFSREHVVNNSFTITNLVPSTHYEVRVCRAGGNSTLFDNCGQCRFCIRTAAPEGRPSAPTEVTATPQSPTVIKLTWKEPSVTNGIIVGYIVQYTQRESGSLVIIGCGTRPSKLLVGLSPNTTYQVVVRARNERGVGVASEVAMGMTPPISNVPGAMLFAQGSVIKTATINEDILANFSGLFNSTNLPMELSSNVTDIDFHYNRSEVYYSLLSGEIQRFSVNVIVDTESGSINLTIASSPEVLVTGTPGEVQSITVDWVNNRLYYVQVNERLSQIYRVSLATGSRAVRVGLPISGQLNSLTVDPIHGFLYWVTSNENVRHANLSVIEGATPSTDLLTISREFLSGNITAFTLDLADSRYFYFDRSIAFSNSLGGGSPQSYRTQFYRPLPALIPYSGQLVIFSPPTRLLVAFSATDVQSSGALGVTAMTMYRSVSQPLPVPPEPPGNVRVVVTNSSATISWNQPVYSSSLFSPTAYNSWIYVLIYYPIPSSFSSSPPEILYTTNTNLTLSSLQPSTLYQFTITARGPGPMTQTTEVFNFTTLNSSMTDPRPSSERTDIHVVIGAAVGGGIFLTFTVLLIIVTAGCLWTRQKKRTTDPLTKPTKYSRQATMSEPEHYSNVPYEVPLQTADKGSSLLPNKAVSSGPQDITDSGLYEEPYQYVPPWIPSEYEVAVSLSTNQSSLDTYSSVESTSKEAQSYMSPSDYTSLHPPNFDSEQHIYTPPLQRSCGSQPQEHTYFTLEYGQEGDNTILSEERGRVEREVVVPFSDLDHKRQSQEHVYFTLDKTLKGIQSV